MKKNSPYLILLSILAGTTVLGQLERFSLIPGANMYYHEIFMVLSIIAYVFFHRYSFHTLLHALQQSTIIKSFLLFTLWTVLSSLILLKVSQIPISLFYTARLTLYGAFGLVLYQLRKEHIITKSQIKSAVLLVGIGIAVLGLLQYVLIPDTRFLTLMGWDDHYYRLISTLFDPGFTGILLASAALLLFYDIVEKKLLSSSRSFLLFSQIVLSFALLLTYSRASFVAFALGLLFRLIQSKKKAYAILLVLFCIGVILLPRRASEGTRLERTASVHARLDTMNAAIGKLQVRDILIGKGWYGQKQAVVSNRYGEVPSHASAPDNSFLFLFSSLGMIGVLLFLWLGNALVVSTHWSPEVMTLFFALSVHALFSNTLFYPFVLLLISSTMAYTAL